MLRVAGLTGRSSSKEMMLFLGACFHLVEIEDDNGNVRYYADCVAQGTGGSRKPRANAPESLVQVGSDGPFGRTI